MPKPSRVQSDGAAVIRVQWAVKAAGQRMPWAVTCLTTAICTQTLSDHLGERTSLKIGVAMDDAGEFKAHAWVECEGQVISGDLGDLPDFTLLTSFAGDAD